MWIFDYDPKAGALHPIDITETEGTISLGARLEHPILFGDPRRSLDSVVGFEVPIRITARIDCLYEPLVCLRIETSEQRVACASLTFEEQAAWIHCPVCHGDGVRPGWEKLAEAAPWREAVKRFGKASVSAVAAEPAWKDVQTRHAEMEELFRCEACDGLGRVGAPGRYMVSREAAKQFPLGDAIAASVEEAAWVVVSGTDGVEWRQSVSRFRQVSRIAATSEQSAGIALLSDQLRKILGEYSDAYRDRARRPRRGSPMSDDFLREVAEVYEAAETNPVMAVAGRWPHTPRNTAKRWIQEARARGLIAPANGRRRQR